MIGFDAVKTLVNARENVKMPSRGASTRLNGIYVLLRHSTKTRRSRKQNSKSCKVVTLKCALLSGHREAAR